MRIIFFCISRTQRRVCSGRGTIRGEEFEEQFGYGYPNPDCFTAAGCNTDSPNCTRHRFPGEPTTMGAHRAPLGFFSPAGEKVFALDLDEVQVAACLPSSVTCLPFSFLAVAL